jgi:hypothetical protein
MQPATFIRRELWRWVPGYEGRYLVSSMGAVRSCGNAKRPKGGRLRATPNKNGYRVVTLYSGLPGRTSGRKMKAAVLVLLAFRGPSNGLESCHADGNRLNDKLSNLYWGTRKDNVDDAVDHGTHPRGSNNGHAVVSERDVVDIRHALKTRSATNAELSRRYRIAPATVTAIHQRKTWRHV